MQKLVHTFCLGIALLFASPSLACDSGTREFNRSGSVTQVDGTVLSWDRVRLNFDTKTVSYRDTGTGSWFTPVNQSPELFDAYAEIILGRQANTNC